jgi:hypothetical protein
MMTMFKTGSSCRRASKVPELRACDCKYYLERCLPEAARLDAQQMNCATCRLKDDTSAALTTLDIDFIFEIATAKKLLRAIFEGGNYGTINET